jgi:hypothetical protein
MATFWQEIQRIGTLQISWGAWSAIALVAGLLLILVAYLEWRFAPPPLPPEVAWAQRLAGAPPAPGASSVEALRIITLLMVMAAATYLPPFRVADPRWLLWIVLVCGVAIAVVAMLPATHRTARALRWSARVHAALEVLATVSSLLFILSLPPFLLAQRNSILTSLTFCSGLTLYREFRRRWRSGDRSWASRVGGFLVVAQFLGLVSVVGVILPLAMLLLNISGILQEPDPVAAAFRNFALALWVISLAYLCFYLVRRLVGAHGFSWFDPPNWRTLWPDLKYKIALRALPRFPFFRISLDSGLADTVRVAYLRSIVGAVGPEIDALARISPIETDANGFSFAIIGDPGEGDNSQLYPQRRARKQLLRQAIQGAAEPHAAESTFLESLLEGEPGDAPDFVIISSDVVYPAGELMDYERAVYRPYGDTNVPIYAIPGNHDWYDNLNGFLLNFTYAAAHEPNAPLRRKLQGMPWNVWLSSERRWRQITSLRDAYHLWTLGGLIDRPESQQRLPFFEMTFPQAPLTILGLDTGVSGSIDRPQFEWLERQLKRAREAGRLIFVLLSMPLYVDAAFAGWKEPPDAASTRGLLGTREIYELLRAYKADVVMGGDTHSFQSYSVRYIAPDDLPHTMHHIVNGGGGAYLSWPVDFKWRLDWRGSKLNNRSVYQFEGRDAEGKPALLYDQVTMEELFPSADDMLKKFNAMVAHITGVARPSWLQRRRSAFRQRYTALALARGLTNALDHDMPPLLQSYVSVRMQRDADDPALWTLTLTPWFSVPDADQPKPQHDKHIVLSVRVPEQSPPLEQQVVTASSH